MIAGVFPGFIAAAEYTFHKGFEGASVVSEMFTGALMNDIRFRGGVLKAALAVFNAFWDIISHFVEAATDHRFAGFYT